MRALDRELFARPPQVVAPELIGRLLVVGDGPERVAVRLTEVEAYSDEDPASHTYRGRTPRNEVMFGEPGHLYVYFSYGMHHCANVVSHLEGRSGGVLLRAGNVVDGVALARSRRGRPSSDHLLARGPGCLTQALGLSLVDGGSDLCKPSARIRLYDDGYRFEVSSGPRVGVRLAADTPWRYWAAGERSVSAYKRSPRALLSEG